MNSDANAELDKLKHAVRSAKIGVFSWDIEKNILIWDEQMYTIYGVNKPDFSGAFQAWETCVHPDDKDMSNQYLQKAIDGEMAFDITFRIVWPDESVHYIKAYGDFLRDANGKALHMTGLNWDVTDKVNAEANLRSKVKDMERLNEIMINREIKMVELKKEIARLKGESLGTEGQSQVSVG